MRGVEALLFLTSVLDGGEWSASRPFTSWDMAPGTHCIGGLVGLISGLDAVEKKIFCPCREQNPYRPARSPSYND
jgi:hypothetical protein